jgi:hypothetical protein
MIPIFFFPVKGTNLKTSSDMYNILCECGEVYFKETGHSRLKSTIYVSVSIIQTCQLQQNTASTSVTALYSTRKFRCMVGNSRKPYRQVQQNMIRKDNLSLTKSQKPLIYAVKQQEVLPRSICVFSASVLIRALF